MMVWLKISVSVCTNTAGDVPRSPQKYPVVSGMFGSHDTSDCSSGGRAGRLVIGRSLVLIPASLGCMLKCPRARY